MSDNPPPPQLKPHTFTPETASAAGKKSAAARAARKALAPRQATELAQQLTAVTQAFERSHLGPAAAATAQQLLSRVLTGDIPVRNGDEAAALLRVMVDVARLEAGQATGHTITATLSTKEAVERVEQLQRQARATIASSTSSTTGPTTSTLAEASAAEPIEHPARPPQVPPTRTSRPPPPRMGCPPLY